MYAYRSYLYIHTLHAAVRIDIKSIFVNFFFVSIMPAENNIYFYPNYCYNVKEIYNYKQKHTIFTIRIIVICKSIGIGILHVCKYCASIDKYLLDLFYVIHIRGLGGLTRIIFSCKA